MEFELRHALVAEKGNKMKKKLVPGEWTLVPTEKDTPQQNNGCDCGVFTCLFGERVAIGLGLDGVKGEVEGFRTEHMERCVEHGELKAVNTGDGAGQWQWPA